MITTYRHLVDMATPTLHQNNEGGAKRGRKVQQMQDYFLTIGNEFENKEAIRSGLTTLKYLARRDQLHSWPKDLLMTGISEEQIASARNDILKTLGESRNRLKSILNPSKVKLESWCKQKSQDNKDLLAKARKNSREFLYEESDETPSPILILKISDINDQNKTLRKQIMKQLGEIARNDQQRLMENYLEPELQYGGESEFTEEDKGMLPDLLKQAKITETLARPEYYPPQIYLAEKIVERIKVIYKEYHKGKHLTSFKDFDFVIYTANINMLEDQTCSRLSRKDSGCFAERMYEGSDKKARKMAKERVYKYNLKSMTPYENFRKKVTINPDTLFLVVADEAHWGATEKDKPHDTLINNWNNEDHPNVILLLVTATPYNLLTDNSRMRMAYYDPSSCDADKPNVLLKEKHTLIPKEYKHLHRVMWTDCFDAKVKKGMIVKLCVPLHGILHLYIDHPQGVNDFLPWIGGRPGTFDSFAKEFLMQNQSGEVRITTIDQEWVLVAKDSKCGFVHTTREEEVNGISSFRILNNYGEDLILLGILGINNRERLLYLEDDTKQVLHRQKRFKFQNDYEVPNLEESFLIEQYRPPESTGPVKEYISLNHYFNSMRNEEADDQLIREDLDGMLTKMIKSGLEGIESDDILAAEYSYYIIITNMIKQYPMISNPIANNFENLLQCIQEFREQCKSCIDNFKEELSKKESTTMPTIKEFAFNKLLISLSTKVMKDFEKNLEDFNKNSTEDTAHELFFAIVSCLLHSASVNLSEVEKKLEDKSLKQKLSSMCNNSDTFNLDVMVKKIMSSSETGHIVQRVIPKSLAKLDGCMTIFRTDTCNSGNKVYNTLCIARKVSSEVDYSFEILRDYWQFKLTDDFEDKLETDREAQSSRYRIRERLQTKKCTHVNPKTLETCHCFYKSTEPLQLFAPSMKCKLCSHIHKKIESYEDLDKLPCILILVHKGRLGDTFPHSLKVVDSRLCYTKKSGHINLASLVQEMGRMCRYQTKSHEDSLPYALIGKHLAKTLRSSLILGAPFHSLLKLPNVQLDGKVIQKKKKTAVIINEESENTEQHTIVANRNHSDYGNTDKHPNRILLGAEPQIGKTGVYLKVISNLRGILSPDMLDEIEEESEDEEDDIDDDKSNDIKDDISYWQYPHWTDIEESTTLRKTVQESKYVRCFGRYQHGNPPPEYTPVIRTKKGNVNTNRTKENKQRTEIQSYNFREHDFCMECSTQYENEVIDFSLECNMLESVENVQFKLSVPKVFRYQNLLNSIKRKQQNESNLSRPLLHTPDTRVLNSWIFIPTYNRSDRANVNLYHTMLSKDTDTYLPCLYTSVLVVRRTEFQQYYKRWQSAHAILQIPDSLPGIDRDVYHGGIGFSRLSIQIFAEALELSWIFMLDDNIRYVYEVEEKDSTVKRENGMLREKTVPLFKVMKHLEKQVDGSTESFPKDDLLRYSVAHTGVTIVHPLEEYTGSSEKYGVIGIKSNSRTCRNVKKPFLKTHVSALVFLNISSLKDKKIYYNPWQVFEDLTLNNDCDDKGLWVCKYNRFTFWKQYMRTWIPYMYIWDNNTDFTKGSEDTQNSDDILINYIRCTFAVKFIIDGKGDFSTILKNINVRNGKHVLITVPKIDILEATVKKEISSSTTLENYFVILVSSEVCIEEKLTTKLEIKKYLDKAVPVPSTITYDVLTSHNVNLFTVRNILITLKVVMPRNPRGISMDSMPSTSKKRQGDKPTERNSKAKEANKEACVPHKKKQRSDEPDAQEIEALQSRITNMDIAAMRDTLFNLLEDHPGILHNVLHMSSK